MSARGDPSSGARPAPGQRRAALCALTVAAVTACAAPARPAPRGEVALRAALAAGVVADAVVVAVAPAGTQATLAADGAGGFAASLTVSAGSQTFTATAYASGAQVGQGSATAVVPDGGAVQVEVRILDTTSPPPSQRGPTITSVVAPAGGQVGAPVALAATAVDPDGGAIAWAWHADTCGGTLSAPSAAATTWTPASAGTCVVTVTATARTLSDARSVTVEVAAGTVLAGVWSEASVGGFGYFDGGPRAGVWDIAPGGQPDHLVVLQGPAAGAHLEIIHGPLGGPLASTTVPTPRNVSYTATAWDTTAWRIHALSWTMDDPKEAIYTRLRPVRDATGRIGAFQAEASFTTQLAAARASRQAIDVSLAEIVDGLGQHRLFGTVTADVAGGQSEIRAFVTTAAAGVAPTKSADFTGLDGGADWTLLKSFPGSGLSGGYGTMMAIVQQPASRRIQVFAGNGLHYVPGPHFRIPIEVSGATLLPPAAASVSSYDGRGTGGGFATIGPGDAAWWTWDDGTEARISRVNGDGTVDWTPLPSLGWRAPYPGQCHIAVRGSDVIVILHAGEADPVQRVRVRTYTGGAWGAWTDVADARSVLTHAGLEGLGWKDGRAWTAAAAISSDYASPPRITAAPFPP